MLLRDSVHGLISFGSDHDELIVRLIDTPEVQRLRRIRALGPASLAFPGAEHSRFAHALGSAHVMWRYLQRMRTLARELPQEARVDAQTEKVALAAALLHDLGHGPYSHSFESVLPDAWPHERWTSEILLDAGTGVHRVLESLGKGTAKRVEQLVHGKCEIRHLARAVSGTFDVDRCDYLLRDSHQTGVRYGHLDLDWLFASLRLYVPYPGKAPRLAVDGEKGLTAVEGFFLARLYMYRQVYLHKAVRSAEIMLHAVFARLLEAGPPPGLHPVMQAALRGQRLGVREYLQLDDVVLEQLLTASAAGPDPVLRRLARGIRERHLLKSVALRPDADPTAAKERLDTLLNAAGWDARYFGSIDRVDIDCYTEDDALVVLLPGSRVQPILEASPVLRGLSRERYVSQRAIFPRELRDAAIEALRDFQ